MIHVKDLKIDNTRINIRNKMKHHSIILAKQKLVVHKD